MIHLGVRGGAVRPCVVGVDGGGSKTSCQIAALDGTVLGMATAGPCNYQTVGEAETLAALTRAIGEAVPAGGARVRIVGLCLALAGVDRPDDQAALRRVARTLVSTPLQGIAWEVKAGEAMIVNDAIAALVGGTGRTHGIVCVAGTGSIAYGINQSGLRQRAGGWGHLLGDEGSGYAIGLEAVRAVCRAADGRGPATALTGGVLQHTSLPEASGLIGLAYGGWGPPQLAALAPLVGAAAAAGDAVAAHIVGQAADELTLAATTVARKLGMLRGTTGQFEVVTAGGLWQGLPALREAFGAAIRTAAPQATVIAPRHTAVEGAVLLARHQASAVSLD